MTTTIDYKGQTWEVEAPTPYHFLQVSDFLQSEETSDRLKTDSFAGFYLIFTCIKNDTGYLADKEDYESFLKRLDFSQMNRLKQHLETFQNIMEVLNSDKDDQDD